MPAPCRAPAAAGAEVILVINGSPFHRTQQQAREQVLAMRAQENSLPLIYVNMVGGQDELVFDGGSVVVDAQGRGAVPRAVVRGRPLRRRARAHGRRARAACGCAPTPVPPLAERVYRALVLGTRDYVEKNGFAGVVLGLSGGVDSALTLTIAVDALGAGARPRRHDAVALHVADEPRGRGARKRSCSACATTCCRSSRCSSTTLGVLEGRVRGAAARHDRGEHPGPLPRRAAHGDLEQDRQDGAHDGQQERDGRRLRDALRRHGGRVRAAQGLHARRSSISSRTTATASRP